MKIRSVGAELLHADGRTDGHDEAFVSFANALNKYSLERHLLTVTQKAAFWEWLLCRLV